ncbi:uncharacterized protein EMH_0093300 [Eimeria mitis]|uniref:Uncharacterized protein n=1 Tax=Eimeria mitis TaxID=44415 RepID=U6KFD2_9EIME|nr:uncharacterized protein EMH_0093300 [Eimeria mitis]CDJ36659.1 hypothetical protein, conserved [Eimeria mitis]
MVGEGPPRPLTGEGGRQRRKHQQMKVNQKGGAPEMQLARHGPLKGGPHETGSQEKGPLERGFQRKLPDEGSPQVKGPQEKGTQGTGQKEKGPQERGPQVSWAQGKMLERGLQLIQGWGFREKGTVGDPLREVLSLKEEGPPGAAGCVGGLWCRLAALPSPSVSGAS